MSLNLGNDAIDALRRLHQVPDTQDFVVKFHDGLHALVRKYMNSALESEVHMRHDATGYARALRDMYVAMESAMKAAPMQRVEKPAPEGNK